MPDSELREALYDADALRRLIEARVADAMRAAMQRVNDEEDDRILYGNPETRGARPSEASE